MDSKLDAMSKRLEEVEGSVSKLRSEVRALTKKTGVRFIFCPHSHEKITLLQLCLLKSVAFMK